MYFPFIFLYTSAIYIFSDFSHPWINYSYEYMILNSRNISTCFNIVWELQDFYMYLIFNQKKFNWKISILIFCIWSHWDFESILSLQLVAMCEFSLWLST